MMMVVFVFEEGKLNGQIDGQIFKGKPLA